MIGNRGTEIGLETKNITFFVTKRKPGKEIEKAERKKRGKEGKEKLFGVDTSIYMHCLPFLSNSDEMIKSAF